MKIFFPQLKRKILNYENETRKIEQIEKFDLKMVKDLTIFSIVYQIQFHQQM